MVAFVLAWFSSAMIVLLVPVPPSRTDEVLSTCPPTVLLLSHYFRLSFCSSNGWRFVKNPQLQQASGGSRKAWGRVGRVFLVEGMALLLLVVGWGVMTLVACRVFGVDVVHKMMGKGLKGLERWQ